jgi:predicted DNA-binding transcriptional regulator AlpA
MDNLASDALASPAGLLNVAALCKYVGITENTVRGFCRARKADSQFPRPLKIGKQLLWRKQDWDSYIEAAAVRKSVTR